jgi:hypothetical protein
VQFVSMLRTLSLNPEELEKLSIAYEDALALCSFPAEMTPSQRSSPNGSSKPPKKVSGIRRSFARWQARTSGFPRNPTVPGWSKTVAP